MSRERRWAETTALLGALSGLVGCASGAPAAALGNKTFYQYDDGPFGLDATRYEQPYPALDRAAQGTSPAYIGVSVLGGAVRLSRPKSWVIRRASSDRERRFIEYVSPNQYLVAIYERLDSPSDAWDTVVTHYEDAKAKGVELLASRVPVAARYAQGRAYVVQRKIRGQKAPYVNTSREALFRGSERVILVELVHQGDTPSLVVDDMLRVMDSLEVL